MSGPGGDAAVSAGPMGAEAIVPLQGNSQWARSDVNNLDLSSVDWIEIHVGAEKPGLKLWLDMLSFAPAQAVASRDVPGEMKNSSRSR